MDKQNWYTKDYCPALKGKEVLTNAIVQFHLYEFEVVRFIETRIVVARDWSKGNLKR